MNQRTAQVMRIATIAVFVLAAVLFVRLLMPSDSIEESAPRPGELGVAKAIDAAGTGPLAVRGWVVQGPGGLGLRLCDGLRNGNPARCIGPYLDVDGVNEGNFALEEGRSDDGVIRWQPDPVTLRGVVSGTRIRVEQILR